MTLSDINGVMQYAMVAGIKVVGPILLVSIIVGFIISMLQAATQIHEQSLTFVPKLLAIAVVMIVLGPWMADTMKDFTIYIFGLIDKLN